MLRTEFSIFPLWRIMISKHSSVCPTIIFGAPKEPNAPYDTHDNFWCFIFCIKADFLNEISYTGDLFLIGRHSSQRSNT